MKRHIITVLTPSNKIGFPEHDQTAGYRSLNRCDGPTDGHTLLLKSPFTLSSSKSLPLPLNRSLYYERKNANCTESQKKCESAQLQVDSIALTLAVLSSTHGLRLSAHPTKKNLPIFHHNSIYDSWNNFPTFHIFIEKSNGKTTFSTVSLLS